MDVPIQHIIGTVALIGLLICVSLAYNIITESMQTEVRKQQLQQVAENVALNLVEVITLDHFSNSIGNVTRTLDLPLELAGKTYVVQIFNDTSKPNSCFVKVYLATMPYVNATSPIPLNATQSQIALETDSTIYGGAKNIVWASKGSGIIRAGLATKVRGG